MTCIGHEPTETGCITWFKEGASLVAIGMTGGRVLIVTANSLDFKCQSLTPAEALALADELNKEGTP